MSKTEFKPEDFKIAGNEFTCFSARVANEKLAEIKEAWKAEMLKDAAVVYGYENEYVKVYTLTQGVESQTKALLLNEEPIVKAECKHEPHGSPYISKDNEWRNSCVHCGVELVAEWKVK